MDGSSKQPLAIFRMEKIKTLGSLKAQQHHTHRLAETRNADPNRTQFNRIVYGIPDAFQGIKKRVDQVVASGKKVRSDSVPAVEVLMTASRNFFECDKACADDWVDANVAFLVDEFGVDNVVQVMLHLDEATPHLHAVIFPRTPDGRLSAKEVMGNQKRLSDLQTRYATAVAHLGIGRGQKKSKARHESVSAWYGKTQQNPMTPEAMSTPFVRPRKPKNER